MLKKTLSLLIFLLFVFTWTFSAYAGPGDDPEPRGHPWNDVKGIRPVPENDGIRLFIGFKLNWMPHLTVVVYKIDYQSLRKVQEMTKKEVGKGEAKSSQNQKYLKK